MQGITDADKHFANMFRRYAFLTTDYCFKRVSCFKQDDPSVPRWLCVQEFGPSFFQNYPLKKLEAEYWWWKNGYEGVIVEFFRQVEVDIV